MVLSCILLGPAHADRATLLWNHGSHTQPSPDLERAGASLVNRRLAYVALSRGRHDVQIYTNDKTQLAAALDRDASHRAAIEPVRAPAAPAQTIERSQARHHGIGFGI
jgi:hypothetical protein